MGKRKNGEGSYGTKTIKGVLYRYYRDVNGNYTYAKTPKELKEKLDRKKTLENNNNILGNNLYTFIEFCEFWLKQNYTSVSPGTYDDYESIINCRIKNYKAYDLSNKQLKSINTDIINKYFASLAKKYSRGSILKTWSVIRQILQLGLDDGYISDVKINKILLPKEEHVVVKKKVIPFITESDMELLYEEANRKYKNGTNVYGNSAKLIIFIMYSGLRLGEAIALKWKHVESDMSSIKISQSVRTIIERNEDNLPVLDENGNKRHIILEKQPKTKDGERIIPLPDRAIEILKYFYENSTHNKDDYVFTTAKGSIYGKRNIERALKSMLKKSNCECKSYTPHSLRHGYGSILISKGKDIKIVSELLGHSDVSFTYNVYIGILKEDKIKAIKDVFNVSEEKDKS